MRFQKLLLLARVALASAVLLSDGFLTPTCSMDQIKERSAPYGDWNISYSVRGSGEPVLLLVHGWGADRSSWMPQLQHLKFPGRIVALDLLGHGKSDQPELDYDLERLAESALAVLNSLDSPQVILAGHSHGVPVCRKLLELAPENVVGLIVVDGPLRKVVPNAMNEAMLKRFQTPDYRKTIRQMNQFLKPTGELTQSQIDQIMQVMLDTPQQVLLSTHAAQAKAGFWNDAPIQVPTLAIYAKNPMWSMWDRDYEQFVRELAPELNYHCWNDTSHLLHLEHAKRFNQLAEAFCRQIIQSRLEHLDSQDSAQPASGSPSNQQSTLEQSPQVERSRLQIRLCEVKLKRTQEQLRLARTDSEGSRSSNRVILLKLDVAEAEIRLQLAQLEYQETRRGIGLK